MARQRFALHVLMAGHGDCLWVDYGSAPHCHHLLIDAGTRGTYPRLEPLLAGGGSQALVVISHIDSDHIAGALPLFTGTHAARVREVWFNGRRHLQPGDEPQLRGAVQGEKLTLAIRKLEVPWNHPFGGRQVSTDEHGNPVAVDLEGGAKLTILSPGWQQLKDLLPQWDKEVTKAGLVPGHPEEEPVAPSSPRSVTRGAIDVDSLADEPFEEDDSAANGSSIAFLMAFGGKRVLFGADAHASVLVQSIRKLTRGEPLEVDVFKLPHHGSKANVSEELIRLVPARQYVFSTNGAYHGHPDPQAVARVIKYGSGDAELVFNCRSGQNRIWDSAALREKWRYRVRYGDSARGVSLQLL